MIVYSVIYRNVTDGSLDVMFKPTKEAADKLARLLPTCKDICDAKRPVEVREVNVPDNGRESMCDFLNRQFAWSFREVEATVNPAERGAAGLPARRRSNIIPM